MPIQHYSKRHRGKQVLRTAVTTWGSGKSMPLSCCNAAASKALHARRSGALLGVQQEEPRVGVQGGQRGAPQQLRLRLRERKGGAMAGQGRP